ncbi:uncharacterized protein [Miscanthus floridulus]|uniref:uncharacterized protein n=1 Tax=Miscanthus floridulus TaxID=154761 RepID=UPI003459064F
MCPPQRRLSLPRHVVVAGRHRRHWELLWSTARRGRGSASPTPLLPHAQHQGAAAAGGSQASDRRRAARGTRREAAGPRRRAQSRWGRGGRCSGLRGDAEARGARGRGGGARFFGAGGCSRACGDSGSWPRGRGLQAPDRAYRRKIAQAGAEATSHGGQRGGTQGRAEATPEGRYKLQKGDGGLGRDGTRGGCAVLAASRGGAGSSCGRRRGGMHLPTSERLRTHDEDADGGGRGGDGGGQGPCNRGPSDAGEDTGGGGRDVADGDCGGSEQPWRTYCGQGAFLAHCHAGSPQLWADPDACAGIRRALCRPRCQEPPRGTERDAAGADFPAVGSDS